MNKYICYEKKCIVWNCVAIAHFIFISWCCILFSRFIIYFSCTFSYVSRRKTSVRIIIDGFDVLGILVMRDTWYNLAKMKYNLQQILFASYIKRIKTKCFTPQWSHIEFSYFLLWTFFSIVDFPPRVWQLCTVT